MSRIDSRSARAALLALAGCALVAAPGCGGSTRAYQPGAATAREALVAALDTWQKGGKPDALAAGPTPVHALDYQWQAGQALEGYEVLAEEPGAGEAETRFAVLLKMKKPKAEQRVQYIIIGRGPIWVFRDQDYARASNMEDNPKPKRPARRR